MSNRRQDTRVKVTLPAVIVRCGRLDPVEVIDVSFHGLSIRHGEALPKMSLQKLRLNTPTCQLEIHVVVAHVLGSSIGMRVFALKGSARLEWERFVQEALTGTGAGSRRAA